MVQLDAGGAMTFAKAATLTGGIADNPFWCHCPGSTNLIGVGADNGTLYVLDTNLAIVSTYAAGSPIRTSPIADAMGDWYFGADDGQLREVQDQGNRAMVAIASYGTAGGPIQSSPVLGDCPVGICVYLGSSDASAYLVGLNARRAVITSCVTSAPPACLGVNPRLWADVVVEVAGSPRTVHVEGWSYYSP
jgi:hypothetical protein